jgi:hypothetical protein
MQRERTYAEQLRELIYETVDLEKNHIWRVYPTFTPIDDTEEPIVFWDCTYNPCLPDTNVIVENVDSFRLDRVTASTIGGMDTSELLLFFRSYYTSYLSWEPSERQFSVKKWNDETTKKKACLRKKRMYHECNMYK